MVPITLACTPLTLRSLAGPYREPVLVSSGMDNCIKMWVFDSPDGTARLLRSREGHRAPPRAVRYYGNTTLATMGEGAGKSTCPHAGIFASFLLAFSAGRW